MRMYEGKVTFAVVGLGGRASAYLAALREFYPDGHAVVAVADPDPKKRLRAAQEYAVPESGLFETDLELMEQPRLADVAIVGTQDALHYRETVALLEKGYDIILEKPISTKMDEALGNVRTQAARLPLQKAAMIWIFCFICWEQTVMPSVLLRSAALACSGQNGLTLKPWHPDVSIVHSRRFAPILRCVSIPQKKLSRWCSTCLAWSRFARA